MKRFILSGFEISNYKDIELRGIKSAKPRADKPGVRIKNVRDAFIQGCWVFLRYRQLFGTGGKNSGNIILTGNNLSTAKNQFVLKDDAPNKAIEEK